MIEVKNLTKTYKTGNKALKGINIQIQDGEFVFIMGRSGSGKSTLLKLLLKELEPTSGRLSSTIWIWKRCRDATFRSTADGWEWCFRISVC